MNIIIVDDEQSALSIFFSDLMKAAKGHHYRFFYDEEDEILEYCNKYEVNAAFLDVMMPSINGVDLAKKLIKKRPHIKLIFITGSNTEKKDLPLEVQNNTLAFFYKPYDGEELYRLLNLLKTQDIKMHAKMFDTFDCFINDRKIQFSSAKAKELLALLFVYHNSTLLMNDAIAHLWPDYEIDKAKILYRDAVWKLRKTLSDEGVSCVEFKRGALSLKTEMVTSDYQTYLATGKGDYRGEFLKNYDWSIDYLAELDEIYNS